MRQGRVTINQANRSLTVAALFEGVAGKKRIAEGQANRSLTVAALFEGAAGKKRIAEGQANRFLAFAARRLVLRWSQGSELWKCLQRVSWNW